MLKDKYTELSHREQKILLFASPVVLVLLVWLGALKPLLQHQSDLENRLEQKQNDLAWMEKIQPQIKSQKSPQKVIPLRQHITQLLRQQEITPERIQANTADQLSVWAKSVPFNRALNVIASAQTRGLKLNEAQISKTEISGMVSIKLTFGQ